VSNRINVRRGVKQGSVLSPVIFNDAIRSAIRHLPPYLIEPYVDASHLSYADDILLLSDDLQELQKAVDSVCTALNGIGLSVAISKTEFLVFGSGSQQSPNAAIQVSPITVFASSSLKYLGLPFGSSIKATRTLIINSLKEKLRKSYGLLARVKGQFDKRTLGRLYNSFFAPHVFFLIPVSQLFSQSERKQIQILATKFRERCDRIVDFPLACILN